MSEFVEKETVQIFPKRLGWPFYLTWIMLTLLSFPVAFLLDFAILRVLKNFVGAVIYVDGVRHITENYLLVYLLVPTVGLLMGAFQYRLLRHYLPRMRWWVIVTIGGWLLGMLLVAIPGWLNWTDTFLTNIDLVFIVFGLTISVGQWSLLRRRLP